MKKCTRVLLSLVLVAIVAAPLMAQEGKKKKKAKKQRGRQLFALRFPKAVSESLTDEQKTSLKELAKEYAPKFKEINGKRNKITSREKMRAAVKARNEARKNGTKGRELQQVFVKALGLTEEQQKEFAAVMKEQQKLNQEVRAKAVKLLTDEQRAKLPKPKAKKKRKKKKSDN